MNKKRYAYIDALRGIAMLAVVINHTYQLTYESEKILTLSLFSVTLFILLAGITAFLSMTAKKIEGYDAVYVKKRVSAIIIPYLIATAFCTFVNGGWHFNFVDYIKAVLLFNGAAPFYFIFFFIQLILLSPILYNLVKIMFSKKRKSLLINTAIAAFVVWFAYFCTEYTTMLELHGGGFYLFGGSYLVVYFLGMILGGGMTSKSSIKRIKAICILSVLGLIFYVSGVLGGYLTASRYLSIYDKWSGNPPGLQLLLYALCIYGVIFALYSLLKPSWLKLLRPLEICGEYSLDIYLYHFYFVIILRNTLFIWVPVTLDNIWLRRICVLIVGVILPVVLRMIYTKVKKILIQASKDILERESRMGLDE